MHIHITIRNSTLLVALVPLLALSATTSCGLLGTDGDSPARRDTTSSNFVWTADTLGKINTVFRDVAILDSNDIWIVGNIPEEDFEGGESYNALHGDGINWNKKRIITKIYSGDEFNNVPLNSITSFPNGKIWVFSQVGGYSELWNGRWYVRFLEARSGMITHAISPANDLAYIAGTSGILTIWENNEFELIPTELESDITGLAYANDTLKFGTEHTLRQYVDGQVIPEYSAEATEAFRLEGRSYDIWHSGAAWWYATSRGLYRFSPDSGCVQMTNRAVYAIAGNGENDVVAVEVTGEAIYHWNGARMTKIEFPKIPDGSPIRLEAIAMKGNQVVIVGWVVNTFGNGVIVTGRRNE